MFCSTLRDSQQVYHSSVKAHKMFKTIYFKWIENKQVFAKGVRNFYRDIGPSPIALNDIAEGHITP